MLDTNGNSKWTMWAIGIMLTTGIAANGMTVNWVNSKFTEHGSRPHAGTVTQERFNDIYNELREIRKQLVELEKQVARLEVKGMRSVRQ